MTKRYKKNGVFRGFACILSVFVAIPATFVPIYAEEAVDAGKPIYGTVAVETEIADEYEIVYENHFNAESDFTTYYNKPESDYPIYPNRGTQQGGGGVKFTWSSDFNNQFGSFGGSKSGTMIRSYNGDSKKHSKGFWFDLDKVLEENGPGTYKFSFRVTLKSGHGLVEGCLNTLENQSDLGNILWNVPSQWGTPEGEDVVGGVNIGGHVLCRRWDESGDINQQVFESITYIPEDAQHLRFLFGGSVDYDEAHDVGGSGWNPVAMDDLVISKKKQSAEMGCLNLKSTAVSIDGAEHSGRLISALYDNKNKLVSSEVSEETVVGAEGVEIFSSLDTSGGYDETYTVKTFFVEVGGHIVPYAAAYNPCASLFPNYSFESPLTDNYRITKYSEPVGLSADAAYTGMKGVELKLDAGSDTFFAVGDGEVLTKDGVNASTTALAKAVWENGAGKYRISFMARTSGDDATVMAQVRRHIFSTLKQDTIGGNGSIEVTPHTHSGAQTITSEWSEIQLDVDIFPMTPWGGAGEYVSYRRNNYPLKLIINGTGSVYIDDFKVEKISD